MHCRAATLFVAWALSGLLLLALAALAWLGGGLVQGWIGSMQAAYGTTGDPPWPLRADVHVHIAVSFLCAVWFGIGCRLFAPRTLPWLPLALALLVALLDETAQLGSLDRHFDWGDQLADATGLALAVLPLLLLRRLRVDAPPA